MADSILEISNKNYTRCLRWHPAGINSWSLSDWAVALSGEVGELCNVVKKLNRHLDLFAAAAGIDLSKAIVDKFNEVSIRNGFPERLK